MSTPCAVTTHSRLPLRHRVVPLFAVSAACLLAHLPPRRIKTVLGVLRTGAAPATYAQTQAARDTVVAASIFCAGETCLQRSLAIALLCRARGIWPTWCTGIHTAPFVSHAWVEADGQPVGEPFPAGYFHALITIP